MKKVIISICCIITLLSCASIIRTRVRNKNIADINCHLEYENRIVSGIYPSIGATLKIEVIELDGKIITNPAAADMVISVSDPHIQIDEDWNKMSLMPNYSDFLSLLNKNYSFEVQIKVAENPFPGKSFTFYLDPSLFSDIVYEGEEGSYTDESSEAGSVYSILGIFNQDQKQDGRKGSTGGRGKDGDDLKIITAYYDVHDIEKRGFSEKTLLLLYEVNNDDLYVSTADTIRISSIGGEGHNGENGDPGKNGGNGGDGGDGGDGGNGGNIEFYYYDKVVDFNYGIQLISKGGEGGNGGYGGIGVKDDPQTNGVEGRPGRNGKGGHITKEKISFEDTLRILKGVSNPNLELSRVVEIPYEEKNNSTSENELSENIGGEN